jgi:hypothetical protein
MNSLVDVTDKDNVYAVLDAYLPRAR